MDIVLELRAQIEKCILNNVQSVNYAKQEVYEVNVPLLDSHNDWITLYVTVLDDGYYIIDDDRWFANNLTESGIRLTSSLKEFIVNYIEKHHCYGSGIKYCSDSNKIYCKCKQDRLVEGLLETAATLKILDELRLLGYFDWRL